MVAAVLAIAVAVAQEQHLGSLIEELRSAPSINARLDAQNAIIQRMRLEPHLRKTVAQVAKLESDIEVRIRLEEAVVASQWLQAPAIPSKEEYRYTLLAAGSKVLLWGGGRLKPRDEGWDLISEAWLLESGATEWKKIAPPPIEWRTSVDVFVSEESLVLWGGERSYGDPNVGRTMASGNRGYPRFRDGAVWNGQVWQRIPQRPAQSPYYDLHSWTGERLFVWGGGFPYRNDGEIWDPKINVWQEIPAVPFKPRERVQHLSLGNRVWLWGGRSWPDVRSRKEKPGDSHRDGAIYDAAKNEWQLVPDSPHNAEVDCLVFPMENKIMVWGGLRQDLHKPEHRVTGALFNLGTGTWTLVPAAPLKWRHEPHCHLIDGRWYLWGGTSRPRLDHPSGWTNTTGASFSLSESSWRPMATCPLKDGVSRNVAWIGDRLLVWGGRSVSAGCVIKNVRITDGAIYDPRRDTWAPMNLEEVPTDEISFGVVHDGAYFFWIETREEVLPAVPPKSPQWVEVPVNRGALWRDGTWHVFDVPRDIRNERAYAVWVDSRLLLWVPKLRQTYVLEPFK